MIPARDLLRLRDRAAHRRNREAYADDGATKYDAVKPCLKGHSPIRYVSNGACVECSQERNARYAEAAKDTSSTGTPDPGRTEQAIRRATASGR